MAGIVDYLPGVPDEDITCPRCGEEFDRWYDFNNHIHEAPAKDPVLERLDRIIELLEARI